MKNKDRPYFEGFVRQDLTMDLEKGLLLKTCRLYFEHFYSRQVAKGDKIAMELTPLHTAFTTGDLQLVTGILDDVHDNKLVKMILNTPVARPSSLIGKDLECSPGDGYLRHILDSLSIDERKIVMEKILSGTIFNSYTLKRACRHSDFVELPLAMASASGDGFLVRTLLSRGVNLEACDSTEENVIHGLVRLSQNMPNRAVAMYHELVEIVPDVVVLRAVLGQSNVEGWKPIELAARLGLPEMLQALMSTEGVYKISSAKYGMVRMVRYNVTEFEGANAKTNKSLLYHLTDMDEAQLWRAQKCRLLSTEPFSRWIEMKFRSQFKLLLSMIMVWGIFVFCYGISVTVFIQTGNPPYIPMTFVAMLSTFFLAIELLHSKANVMELVASAKGILLKGHVPVTFTFAYRSLQLVFCVNVIVILICLPFIKDHPEVLRGFVVTGTFLCALSTLFYLQVQPQVGHLLIILQKILFDSCTFFFMMLLIYLAFALSLLLLHVQIPLPSPSNLTICDSPEGFPTEFGAALYETFLLMFAVMAPKDLLFQSAIVPEMAVLMYMLLLIIVSIGLVNLLIAIMTKRIDDISQLKDDILKLERVSIILYMEQRCQTKLLRICLQAFHRLCRYILRKGTHTTTTIQTTEFFVRTPDGCVFLDVIEPIVQDDTVYELP